MRTTAAVLVRSLVVGATGAAAVWVSATRSPDGDFAGFLLALLLTVVLCGGWAAYDAGRADGGTTLLRWGLVCVLVAVGAAVVSVAAVPGAPPAERVAEVMSVATFYVVPLAVGAAAGVVVGAVRRSRGAARPPR